MNPLRALLFLAAVIASTYGYCYDAKVAADQYFDDSFVCDLAVQNLSYPSTEIETDLYNLQDVDMQYFLDTSASCVNESRFFSNSYQATGDYAYRCVCPTRRRRIEAVYVNREICHVVYPEQQDVHYASCSGHCTFDYGTPVVNNARGYFCAYSGYVQREFAVWCPHRRGPPAKRVLRSVPGGRHPNVYRPYGTFRRVVYNLPTLCACRGYFCSNHAQAH